MGFLHINTDVSVNFCLFESHVMTFPFHWAREPTGNASREGRDRRATKGRSADSDSMFEPFI